MPVCVDTSVDVCASWRDGSRPQRTLDLFHCSMIISLSGHVQDTVSASLITPRRTSWAKNCESRLGDLDKSAKDNLVTERVGRTSIDLAVSQLVFFFVTSNYSLCPRYTQDVLNFNFSCQYISSLYSNLRSPSARNIHRYTRNVVSSQLNKRPRKPFFRTSPPSPCDPGAPSSYTLSRPMTFPLTF